MAGRRAGSVRARAASVEQIIRESGSGSSRMAVDFVVWNSIEKMEEARAFDDQSGGQYVAEIGTLTRRVDIVLVDPGACGIGVSHRRFAMIVF